MKLVIWPLLFVPATAYAEGAVQNWHCTVTQNCTVAGACVATSDSVTFRLMPQDAAPDGVGTYDATYGEESVVADWTRRLGPIIWTDAAQRENTLMISTQTDMLWHIQNTDDPASSEIRFLICEVTQ